MGWSIETWVAVLTFASAVVGGIVAGGVWMVKLVVRLSLALRAVEGFAKLVQDVGFIKSALEREGEWRSDMNEKFERHIRSDHRELRGDLQATRDIAVRAEALSSHDFDEE